MLMCKRVCPNGSSKWAESQRSLKNQNTEQLEYIKSNIYILRSSIRYILSMIYDIYISDIYYHIYHIYI